MDYNSTQTVTMGGKKIVRKVTIKHNKGFKSVTKYHKGRRVHTVKNPIHKEHVPLIKKGKFIPGLFSDCKFCKSKKCKHCKTKKLQGGEIKDLEMGPESTTEYMKNVPPRPDRFKDFEERERLRSISPIPPTDAEKFFSGPSPRERQQQEWTGMADEDKPPLYPPNVKKSRWTNFLKRGGGKTKKRGGMSEKEWEDYVKRQNDIDRQNSARSYNKLQETSDRFSPPSYLQNSPIANLKNFQDPYQTMNPGVHDIVKFTI